MHQNFQSPEPQTVSKFHLGIVYSKQRRYQHCMPKYWRAHVRGLCAGTSMPMDKIGMHLSKLPRLEKKKALKMHCHSQNASKLPFPKHQMFHHYILQQSDVIGTSCQNIPWSLPSAGRQISPYRKKKR